MHITSYTPQPIPPRPAAQPTSPATLDWVLQMMQRHLLPVDGSTAVPAMATAWSLGLAGATREQLHAVILNKHLRNALFSIVQTVARMRSPEEVPPWAQVVLQLSATNRRSLAQRVQAVREISPTRVAATEASVFAVLRAHPQAVIAHDRSFVDVPDSALDALLAASKMVTSGDVDALLAQAQGPFTTHMAQVALRSAEATGSVNAA